MGTTDFFDMDLQRRGSAKGGLGQATDVVGNLKPDELPARPLSDLNLTRMARHREEVNTQVATAKVEIERLRRRQGDLEREKQSLEDLMDKQDQYERGKQEMIQRLSESVVSLEKLEENAARQTEIYSSLRARFGQYVEELHGLNDAAWSDDAFREELNKAVVQIDAIRKEFVKGQAAVEAVGGPVKLFDEARPRPAVVEADTEPARGFLGWVKIGIAVSAPLILTIIVALIILMAGR